MLKINCVEGKEKMHFPKFSKKLQGKPPELLSLLNFYLILKDSFIME